jgi:hypothetical protein
VAAAVAVAMAMAAMAMAVAVAVAAMVLVVESTPPSQPRAAQVRRSGVWAHRARWLRLADQPPA